MASTATRCGGDFALEATSHLNYARRQSAAVAWMIGQPKDGFTHPLPTIISPHKMKARRLVDKSLKFKDSPE